MNSSKLIIGKNVIEEAKKVVSNKKGIWEEKIPMLKFDQWGRANLCTIPVDALTIIKDYVNLYKVSYDFIDAFNDYLKEKQYKLVLSNGFNIEEIEYHHRTYICYQQLCDNKVIFINKFNKRVSVKASRVFAGVQEIWITKYPLYTMTCDRIKQLRNEGKGFENEEVSKLSEFKNNIENHNLYFMLQKYSNVNIGTQDIYLSINPLDLLTASGNGSDYNPTGFGSCWDVGFNSDDVEDMYAYRNNCYSNPKGMFALGSIINRGIIYIPNNKILQHGDFDFIGYKERSHVWLDEIGIWVEKVYPSKSLTRQSQFETALANANIDVVKEVSEFQEFKIQDRKSIKNYVDIATQTGERLFLDREAISYDNYTLHYLKYNRTEYDYNNPDSFPEENERKCACCGSFITEEDTYYTLHNGDLVCEGCYDNECFTCEECEEIFYNSRGMEDDNGDTVCDICYSVSA